MFNVLFGLTTVRDNCLPQNLLPFIWRVLKPHKTIVALYVVLALTASVWGPINSVLVKKLINLLPTIKPGEMTGLLLPATLIIVNIIINTIVWCGIKYILAKFVPIILNQVMADTMDYIINHSHQFYQNHLSGNLSKQIANLADGINLIITFIAVNFLSNSALILIAIVTSYYVSPIFCTILIIWLIFFTTISVFMSKKLILLANIQATAEADVAGALGDVLYNSINIKLFARKAYEKNRMIKFFSAQQQAYTANYMYSMLLFVIQGTLLIIMMSAAIFYLIKLYGKGLVTVGDFALIVGLSIETGAKMWDAMAKIAECNKAVGKCKQSLLNLIVPIEIIDQSRTSTLNCHSGKITFNNVTFQYQGHAPLLYNQSLEILPGQKIGLVGMSGGGKSTFVNLILRLFDVTAGEILIDDQDIRHVTQESLRENIAVVQQEPLLFQRKIIDNIRYGHVDASDEHVIAAAKQAHAHEFIAQLPQGYESLVGEKGLKLSGGQRQRIALARAMLKNNARILILDEATSQLDSKTDNLIQASLKTLMQHKTTIVIVHRMTTLIDMDRILVFDQGKIVEDGNHSTLLAKNGLYKRLWDAQFISSLA